MKHYIMVTNFDEHWNVANTGFSSQMLRFTEAPDASLPVIFIKRIKNGGVVKAWKGHVSNFQRRAHKTDLHKWWFDVHLESEIPCPPQLLSHKEGWYIEEMTNGGIATTIQNTTTDYPPFFAGLKSDNWQVFEDSIAKLLRLLGIHTLFQYDKNQQKGKPDGFFKIDNTFIIYDGTLATDFRKEKETQIENFCSQLKHNKYHYEHHEFDLRNCDKFVWIITRGANSSIIKQADDVVVKEVGTDKLVELYHSRLADFSIDEKKLEQRIHNI